MIIVQSHLKSSKEKNDEQRLQRNTIVLDSETDLTGRLVGWFVRKGERWWTIYWENDLTTAEKEAELQVG